jgi:hypothetical protein
MSMFDYSLDLSSYDVYRESEYHPPKIEGNVSPVATPRCVEILHDKGMK